MLERIHDCLWVAEGDVVGFFGFPYPTRSVVVRFRDASLWVWSPVKLSDDLRAEVDQLGRVAHLVSPNKLHHLFLAEWKTAYPDARLWGPLSSIKRHPTFDFEAPLEDAPPRDWGGEIEQAWFRGSFAMDEIVFFHRPSGAAIIADLIEAFDDCFLREHWAWWQRPLARLDGIVAENPRAPLEWRLSFRDRAPARAARAKALSWNCQRAIIAHGQWARAGGHRFLERSLAWLGPMEAHEI